jgi:putative component of toxin-antitoxin plasmid stabilization module
MPCARCAHLGSNRHSRNARCASFASRNTGTSCGSESDYLRDGIYELRATHRGVNYRILYFFHGRKTAVLSHLITKEAEVPDREINRAERFKRKFAAHPDTHTLRI